ncbi:hypothetical protein EDB84DRAFT_293872 [Lactarius hengduanensis]|nr:hypothetical protein EDB84DRAFT_293872 [Lactarius hengduanensis]
MASLPVDVNSLLQGSEATVFVPDEGVPVIYPQVVDTAAPLEAMRAVCYQLLQILDTPYNVSSTAQFRVGEHQDPATSETYYPQLELVRVVCSQLPRVLEAPYNVSNAATIVEHQVLQDPAIYGVYPQVTLTATQLEFVWVTYYQLLQIYDSLRNESNATRLGGHQVSARSQIVALTATHLELVLVVCYQLLQVHGLPGGNSAARLGELADNVSQIQPPTRETSRTIDAQENGVPAGDDTSGRLHCFHEDCEATFGRPQERKRHVIDVHTLRRQCPFCLYSWSRPDKIRAHLIKNHHHELPQEVLNEIRAKRGQHLVAFLTPPGLQLNRS